MANPPLQVIPKCLVHDAILHPPVTLVGHCAPSSSPPSRSVHRVHLPGSGPLAHPHDLDRLPLLDHLLERLQHLHRGAAAPVDRVHRGPASLAGERLPHGRPRPAGDHRFEQLDIGNDTGSGVCTSLFLEKHCVDPVGESLCDFDIVAKVAEKLGLLRGVYLRQDPRGEAEAGLRRLRRRAHGQLGRTAEEAATS